MEEDKKKKRKRLKEICKQIRQQMEFYFSDSNLHKDRFLKKQIDQTEDGWLELEMFGRFNKIKSLTTDMELVAKALSTSELLQVSDDAKRVKRKIPLRESSNPKDVDERTVYVECLPSEADHDWVKSAFSAYGKVLYVSLPKYKSTGDIKGFAFVEFEKTEDAKCACEEMNKQSSDKSEKIGKFPTKGCKEIQRLQKQLSAQKNKRGQRNRTVSETEVTERKEQLKKTGTKRNRLWSQGSGHDSDHEFSSKKMKLQEAEKKVSAEDSSSSGDSDSEDEPEVKKSKQEETNVVRKRKLEPNTENNADKDDSVEPEKKRKVSEELETNKKTNTDETQKTIKKNKRKKKVKDDKKNIPDLKVIPKIEWLKLRNEYITLQKNNMKKLKASWKKVKEDQASKGEAGQGNETDLKENEMKAAKKSTKGNSLEFKENVIVFVQSDTEIVRKKLKEELSAYGQVAYIDVIDGDKQAHVRCESAEAAKQISNATLEHIKCSVLKGDEEKLYWDKILKDREEKLNSKSKPKKRGKDKAIAKVAAMKEALNKKTHVFFDDT